jgi:dihydroorotate dehydrogenase (NAD+) catalytic subunit
MMAGATAVQVGTATFADPRAPWRVLDELRTWFAERDLTVDDVVGVAHRGGLA